MISVVPTLLVFFVSVLAPIAVRPLLARRGVVDMPNHRSSHLRPTLRGGGLGVLLALSAGLALALAMQGGDRANLYITFTVALFAIGLLGWLEDFRGVGVSTRLVLQFLVGALAAVSFCLATGSGVVWVAIGAVCFASYVNVANFMDGINGISSLHGVVAGSAFGMCGLLVHNPWLVVVGPCLAAAFLGFLPWNVIGHGLFLGDSGSYVLGAGVAMLALVSAMSGVPVPAVVGPLAIYLADAGSTLVRRIWRGEKWREPHRSHVYQRLTDRGLSHLAVAGIVSGLSALCAGFGLLSFSGRGPALWLAIGGIVVIVAGYLTALPVAGLLMGERTTERERP